MYYLIGISPNNKVYIISNNTNYYDLVKILEKEKKMTDDISNNWSKLMIVKEIFNQSLI